MARNYIEKTLCTPEEAIRLSTEMPVGDTLRDAYIAFFKTEHPEGATHSVWNVMCLMTVAYTLGRVQAMRELRARKKA